MERRQFLKESLLLGALLGTGFCSSRKSDNLKVVVLGFDGANWPTLDPLLDAGHLPFLNQLKQNVLLLIYLKFIKIFIKCF